MLYQRRPLALEAFAFHEWVDTPARMLAPLLVRALQDSAAFRVVLLAPSSALAGWRLETELLRLHQDFTVRPSQLRLGLRAVLLDVASRQVVAWREFEFAVAAADDGPVAGVQAAHQATVQLAQAVAHFCDEQAAAASPARAAVGGRPGG
jgi:cholesterol transport system auxiliary component